jgi:hypothetical protein
LTVKPECSGVPSGSSGSSARFWGNARSIRAAACLGTRASQSGTRSAPRYLQPGLRWAGDGAGRGGATGRARVGPVRPERRLRDRPPAAQRHAARAPGISTRVDSYKGATISATSPLGGVGDRKYGRCRWPPPPQPSGAGFRRMRERRGCRSRAGGRLLLVQCSSACSMAGAPASASIAVVRTRPSSVPAQYLRAAGPAPEQLVLGVGGLDRRVLRRIVLPRRSAPGPAASRPIAVSHSWTAS